MFTRESLEEYWTGDGAHMDVKILLGEFAEQNAYKGNANLLVPCFYHSISSGY